MKLTGTFKVLGIKKKTQAEFFKDLKVGDEFELSYTINGSYGSAPWIKLFNGKVAHYNNATQLTNNLDKFEIVQITHERLQKIQFIIDSVWHLEDAEASREELDKLSAEELEKEVEWYEHLWTK